MKAGVKGGKLERKSDEEKGKLIKNTNYLPTFGAHTFGCCEVVEQSVGRTEMSQHLSAARMRLKAK